MRSQHGFTLIELMMVMFIIAIIITISVVYLNPSWVVSQRGESALAQVEQTLKQLQFKAINDNQPMALAFNDGKFTLQAWSPSDGGGEWQPLSANLNGLSQSAKIQLQSPVNNKIVISVDGLYIPFQLTIIQNGQTLICRGASANLECKIQ